MRQVCHCKQAIIEASESGWLLSRCCRTLCAHYRRLCARGDRSYRRLCARNWRCYRAEPISLSSRYSYAVVIQDTRGRYTSEGEFYAFRDDIHDGYDTVEWVASQPWSLGKVGMYGNSYVGATQWQAAKSCPPHLAAIAPRVTASNYHEGWTYQGGAFELGFNVSWTLGNLTLANFQSLAARKQTPHERRGQLVQAVDALESVFHSLPLKAFPHLQDGLADYFYDWLAHPDDDAYWQHLSMSWLRVFTSAHIAHLGHSGGQER